MPNNDRIIVGIDVGTYKVCTIVAEADPTAGGRLNVLGVGAVASEGMAKGMITDIVAASKAIEHSLEAAERQSGCRILSAYVSISGNHISTSNSRGLVAVSNPDRIITQDDVNRAIEAAGAVPNRGDRDVLHIIPRTYTIDGQEGIRNPVGMSGFRLDVEAHIATAAGNARENVIRCVQKADVEVDDLVLSPFAAAEAALTEQEKNMGVAIVDMGHGTTDIAIYVDGSVWHTRILPVGGWHLSNDLAYVFNIPYESAEALKLQYGEAAAPGASRRVRQQREQREQREQQGRGKATTNGALALVYSAEGQPLTARQPLGFMQPDKAQAHDVQLYSDDEVVEAQTFEGTTRSIPRGEFDEVLASRLEQMLGMINDEIRRSGYEGLLPAGVVLTGGVTAMPGLDTLAANRLRMPVRVGKSQRIGGLADAFDSPAYATTVGLTLWGLRQGSHHPGNRAQSAGSSILDGAGSRLAKWLRGFLP